MPPRKSTGSADGDEGAHGKQSEVETGANVEVCQLSFLVALHIFQLCKQTRKGVIFRLLTRVPLAPGLPPPPKLDATISKGRVTTEYCDSQGCVAGDKQGRDGFCVLSLVTVSRLLSAREPSEGYELEQRLIRTPAGENPSISPQRNMLTPSSRP